MTIMLGFYLILHAIPSYMYRLVKCIVWFLFQGIVQLIGITIIIIIIMAACINFSSLADRILIYPIIILLCTGTHVHLIHSLLINYYIIMNEHKLLLATGMWNTEGRS